MPIYEYKCLKTGEVFELRLPISSSNEHVIICALHTNHQAEKVWSVPATLNHSKPTIYLENPKTKEVHLLPSDNPRIINEYKKRGFAPKEVKNSMERSKLEHKLQTQIHIEHERKMEAERYISENTLKNRQRDLTSRLNGVFKVPNKEGEIREVTLDTQEKEFVKRSMEYTKKKKEARFKEKEKRSERQILIEANHFDKGNRNRTEGKKNVRE